MRIAPLIATAMIALISSGAARGDFIMPPWTRGDADTTYQEWNTFTDADGLNDPDVANSNPNGTATVLGKEPSAFLVGGNIYSFSEPTDFDVTIPNFGLGSGFLTSTFVQVRSRGTEIDPASVTLRPSGGTAIPFDSSEELDRVALGGQFGGFQVDTLYRWDVAGNAPSYMLDFTAAGSSMSLDRLSVDTLAVVAPAVIPEPATVVPASLGLLGLVVAGIWRGRRRLLPGRDWAEAASPA